MKFVIPESVTAKINGLVSRGIKAVEVDESGDLYFTLTDGSVINLGSVLGPGSSLKTYVEGDTLCIESDDNTYQLQRIENSERYFEADTVEGALNELFEKVPEVDDTLSESGKAADAKAVGVAIDDFKKSAPINIAEQPDAYLMLAKNRIMDDRGWTFAQQGMTVTDKYIILVGPSVASGHANEGIYVYILDKDSYAPIQPTSIENFAHASNPFFLYFDNTTTPTSCHANCAAWNSDENKIYIGSGVMTIAVVLDAETFEQLTPNPQIKYSSFDYDNIRHEWAINKVIDGNYAIEIRGEDFGLLTTITGKADSSAQGFCYYDGVCYIPVTHGTGGASSEYSDVYNGYSNVLIIDRNSNLLRNWLYPRKVFSHPTDNEIEDIAITNGGRMIMAFNDNYTLNVYEARYMQSDEMLNMKNSKQGYLVKSGGSLVDDTAYQKITITKETSFTWGSIHNQECYKVGNLVIINLQIDITESFSGGWKSFAPAILPKPPAQFDVASIGYDLSDKRTSVTGCLFRITLSGRIEIAGGVVGTHYVSCCYPTSNI